MLTINRNKITLTRGDSAEIQLALTKNGETFTPAVNDVIKFYVATVYKGQPGYNLLIEKEVDTSLLLKLEPEDTEDLGYGTYCFDLEITYASGAVDTFLSGTLRLTGEVG